MSSYIRSQNVRQENKASHMPLKGCGGDESHPSVHSLPLSKPPFPIRIHPKLTLKIDSISASQGDPCVLLKGPSLLLSLSGSVECSVTVLSLRVNTHL